MATKKKVVKKATKKKVVKKATKKKVVKRATKKKVAKKTTKKKATKKKARGRRLASADMPKYEPKKHIKINDLANELGISYQTLYLRQTYDKKIDAFFVAQDYKDNFGKKRKKSIVVFSKEDATKLRKTNPKKMRRNSLTLNEVGVSLKCSRPKIVNHCMRLGIQIKKQRNPDNRQVLTITTSNFKKLQKEMQE